MLKKFIKLSKSDNIIKLGWNSIVYVINKYVFFKKSMVKNIHGYKMRLSLTDPGISRALAIVGTREKETKYILEKAIHKDADVIDVGANIGYYVLMERNLTNGMIYAFEPDIKNFADLNENILLNKADKIHCYHAAVSNKRGTATMHLSKLSNVHTLLPDDVLNQMSGETVKVKTIKLSKHIKEVLKKPIDLIRMDIEGYEVEVLEDVVEMVSKQIVKPAVLFEIHSQKYNEEHSLTKQLMRLMKLGYRYKYMASTHIDKFTERGYKPEAKLLTDGTVRYIFKDVNNSDALELVDYCRAVLIK